MTAEGLQGDELRSLVHNLAGAAGVFGFSTLSTAAIVIDDRYAEKTLPDTALFTELETALTEVVNPSGE